MKELKTYVQEPYEAPAIEEIVPVTTVCGQGDEEHSNTPGDNDDNSGGYSPDDPE